MQRHSRQCEIFEEIVLLTLKYRTISIPVVLGGNLTWIDPRGGVGFERLVENVKRPIRKVLGNARLNFDELLTVLLEIGSTLSSRPLTYKNDEVWGEMLTPSHLIFGFRLSSLPDIISSEEQECALSANKKLRKLREIR